MKLFLALGTLILLTTAIPGFSQSTIVSGDSGKIITLLKDSSFEIKEFTKDSILFLKGKLISIDPEIRHGRFYFYNKAGKVEATGLYNQNVPYGTWVYLNENNDTIKTINYSTVWNYLETNTSEYDSTETFYMAQKMPKFNGGDPEVEFEKYVNENLFYPIYELKKGISRQVDVQFIIDSEGKIRNPVIVNSLISNFNIEVFRLLSESPVWEPGYQNNHPINVRYNWSFRFSPLYGIVDEMPLFNGGDPAIEFRKHIRNKMKYPYSASEKGISGRVIVQFTVNTEGYVENPVVLIGVHPLLDAEAIRVVMISPRWTPGKQNGKPVKLIYTFPFNFVLN